MRRQGFSLVELLFTIPLMLVVVWLLTGVFLSAVRETPVLQRMAQTQNSLCRLAQRMQVDADAASVVTAANGQLTITTPAGRLEYHITAAGAQRVLFNAAGVGRVTDTWDLPGAKIGIEPLDGCVRLTTAIEDRRGIVPLTKLVLCRLIRPLGLGQMEAAP